MATIGKYTVAIVLGVFAYVVISLLFNAAGYSVDSNPSYWFGAITAAANVLIVQAVTK